MFAVSLLLAGAWNKQIDRHQSHHTDALPLSPRTRPAQQKHRYTVAESRYRQALEVIPVQDVCQQR